MDISTSNTAIATISQNQAQTKQVFKNNIMGFLMDSVTKKYSLFTAVEMTGFVKRVSLMAESIGQEVLDKIGTKDCRSNFLHENQLVVLSWSKDNCIFLPN